jgi:uncharacterized membrane protein YeaQ/YmgE (transglycosylase-associated protein family)
MFFSLLFALLVGATAGWIASKIVSGQSLGLGTNIIVGMVGAAIARFVFPSMGLGTGLIAAILHATIGALVLLVILRVVKRL